jgi:hypothetical protein
VRERERERRRGMIVSNAVEIYADCGNKALNRSKAHHSRSRL